MSGSELPAGWTHRYVTVRGVTFHYVEAGAGQELVVLLHGFPECWYSWRRQIPVLAEAGYRVVAVDMRGYNLSDKPKGVEAYQVEALTDDVAELIQAWGCRQAVVVGHDWGGLVAWFLAMRRPEVMSRLIVMNAGHPAAYFRELKRGGQLIKSWYVFMFQVPGLVETMLKLTGYQGLRKTFLKAGCTPAEVDEYEKAWRQPGAMTAGLNYYRAAFRRAITGELQKMVKRTDVPTLLIWGEEDAFGVRRLTEGLEPWVADLRVERLAGVGHWVQSEVPNRVNELLVEYLGDRRSLTS